ncbi:Porin D precursor [compost metagenome]
MGDQPFDYAAIGDTSPGVAIGKYSQGEYLANPGELSDFNAPQERSWQLRYDLNMADYGVPGLTMMAKQVWGSNIDGTHVDQTSAYFGFYGKDESERETDVSLKYVIQSGPAKALGLTLVGAKHNGSLSTGGDNTMTRFVVDYPINFF